MSGPDAPAPAGAPPAKDAVPGDPLLDHLEKTLADNYRKEIDQEDNVWRSLPFFAAGLALQIAAVLGLSSSIPADGTLRSIMLLLFSLIAIPTLLALFFLAESIAPARFRYIAPEPDLRSYALQLAEADRSTALLVLKAELALQYAISTHNNRLINQRRARKRSMAGLCMLASLLATLVIVAIKILVTSEAVR